MGGYNGKDPKTFTSKKMRLKRESHRPFALMSSRASPSIVVALLKKLFPSSVRSFGSIWTSWKTSSVRFANTSKISLCRRCAYTPLAQCRAWARLNSFPHGQIAGLFFASQVLRNAIPSRNAVFVRSEPCFDNRSALSQQDAPYPEASWIVYFISGRLFLILDFFEMSSRCMSAFCLRPVLVCSN